jgi:hypothetical protein
MYISLKYRFLYYRIPKTASTSLSQGLDPYLYKFSKPMYYAFNDYADGHYTPTESLKIFERLGFQIPIYKNFTSLMVTRHPYTRINSLYNYSKLSLEDRQLKTFDCFLDVLGARANNDSQALILLKRRVYDSQLLWTNDQNAVNLTIIKYENLNEIDIASILKVPKLSLSKENVGIKYNCESQLTPHQKEKIYSIYEEEFDTYSYKK